MAQKIKLYGFNASPPVRGVMMAFEAIGVDYELKVLDVLKMEHHEPEYLKMNPIHSIPTIVDGDYVLFDSHAISAYIANKYGKDDKWYPKNPEQRGIVEQRLYFNCSVLIPAVKKMGVALLFGKQPPPDSVQGVKDAMLDLEKLLGDQTFIAMSWPTIADCMCVASVLTAQGMVPESITPRLAAWLKRCEEQLPGYSKVNNPALEEMKVLASRMKIQEESKM